MFSDAYTTIENAQAVTLIEKLNPKLDGSPFDPYKIRLISHSLSFYNGYFLFEVSDFDNSPSRIFSFIAKEDGSNLFILNGTNEPIYTLNKSAPIFLNADLVKTYARFFFYYVRGRFGRFYIIDNVDDINWREEPTLAGRKALSKMIKPLEFNDEDKNGVYYLKASIIFKDSLFSSDITIEENGNVSLSNQEMMVEDIPILDDSFNQ